ncbi:hypothetical protein [Streptomyces sp. NPDC058401]|uniref:hypothetical protein n=1 Tax=Streptomyces sp. NPDC058401 TaxID=3346480 RepID=UPI0036495DC0
MKRLFTLLTAPLITAALLLCGVTPATAAGLDGTCTATINLGFTPPVTGVLLPSPAPVTHGTGNGTITTCVIPGGGATTGTFTYDLTGNLTCVTAQNITGTFDITWADTTTSHATVTGLIPGAGGALALAATITSGRFTGDQITVANVRDPAALLTCLLSGLSSATGITSLTFTSP